MKACKTVKYKSSNDFIRMMIGVATIGKMQLKINLGGLNVNNKKT